VDVGAESRDLSGVTTTVSPAMVTNALTVDVEDWYHDESRAAGPARVEELAGLGPRIEANLERLLTLFQAAGARATLFVLGDVAARAPGLVRTAAALGHEIASHGWRHVPVTGRSPAELREDVRRARATLEDVIGAPVLGFRAPCFLRRPADLWALDAVAAEGYRYDSSYLPLTWWPPAAVPISPDLRPVRLPSGLWEFPLPLSRLPWGDVLSVPAGGFVLRALPLAVTRSALRRFNRTVGPGVVYTHPWELDPGSAKLPGTPGYVRFFNGFGRQWLPGKLERLLAEFRFAPLAEVYATELRAAAAPATSGADPAALRSRHGLADAAPETIAVS
jgi:polysaccharide deacetylase family protein (PEP-CTERM system associated)